MRIEARFCIRIGARIRIRMAIASCAVTAALTGKVLKFGRGLSDQFLRQPHNLSPHIAVGDLAYERAVLLSETGRAVLLERDPDLV